MQLKGFKFRRKALVCVVVLMLVAAVCRVGVTRYREATRELTVSEERDIAKTIWVALYLYAQDFDGAYPDSLDELFPAGALAEQDRSLLYRDVNDKSTWKWRYTPGLSTSSPPWTVLFELKEPKHGEMVVAYINGAVKRVRVE